MFIFLGGSSPAFILCGIPRVIMRAFKNHTPSRRVRSPVPRADGLAWCQKKSDLTAYA